MGEGAEAARGPWRPPSELPPGTRALVNLLAARMAGAGLWTLEFRCEDGAVVKWFRHEGPAGADDLARFDVTADGASA